MHTHSIDSWRHEHVFLGGDHARNERRTWAVIALTAAMMVAEIVGGAVFGSMALMADGWHMSTHAGALAISVLAYRSPGATHAIRALPSARASSATSPAFRARSCWRWSRF